MSRRYSENCEYVTELIKNFIRESIINGYIIEKGEKKTEIKKGKVFGNFHRVNPMTATIELTRFCPLKCKHCYISAGKPLPNEMNIEQVMTVLDKLTEMGINKIFITGGEPTSKQNFFNILERVSQQFFVATVATSGYLINDKFLEKTKSYKNILWQISIDGEERTHNLIRGREDSFKRADFAIRALVKLGLPVTISFTINPLNRKEMESIIKYGKEAGVLQVLIGRTMSIGNASDKNWNYNYEEFKEIENEVNELKKIYETDRFLIGKNEDGILKEKVKEQKNCGAGYVTINVLPDGTVTPCTSFELHMGNLLTDSIDDIFGSTKAIQLKELESPTKNLCGTCQMLYACDGCHVV